MDTISVLIIDDTDAKAQNITRLLQFEPDIRVVGHASTGEEGLSLYGELHPDVVLMDTNLPDSDGFGLTRDLISRD